MGNKREMVILDAKKELDLKVGDMFLMNGYFRFIVKKEETLAIEENILVFDETGFTVISFHDLEELNANYSQTDRIQIVKKITLEV